MSGIINEQEKMWQREEKQKAVPCHAEFAVRYFELASVSVQTDSEASSG